MPFTRRQSLSAVAGAALAPKLLRAQSDKILRIGLGGMPTEKGNAFSNIQTPSILLTGGVFDGLTRMTKSGDIVPWLATAWQALDETTWRFTLRDDVAFSNGEQFDAAAVKFTVDYLSGPGPMTEGLRRDFRFLTGATVIDRTTIDISTSVPTPMLPRYASVLLIVAPEAWRSMGVEQFSITPVGTGPLTVDNWHPAGATLLPNTTSWRPIQFDGVEYIVLKDPSSRFQALMSGAIDAAYQTAPEDIPFIEDEGGSVVSVLDGAAASIMLQFGPEHDTPLRDKRVRHALNHAVDKQTIVDVLLGGQTVVSSQPAVRASFGYDPSLQPFAYDPELALALLKDAGAGDGFAMTILTSGGGTNGQFVVQRVADDLNRVGIRAEVQQRPVMQFLTDFVRGRIDTDAFTLQWGTYPLLDAIQVTNINSCRKTDPWFCDQTIQPVIERAWVETDPIAALALRHQIMGYYRDMAPSIFLHENIAFVGLSPRTRGFDQTFGYIDFEGITLS